MLLPPSPLLLPVPLVPSLLPPPPPLVSSLLPLPPLLLLLLLLFLPLAWRPAGLPSWRGGWAVLFRGRGLALARQPAGFVLLVSGLLVGGKHDPLLVSLLVDFVAGYLGGAEDQEGTIARIGRVIVCGDSVAPPSAELLNGTGPSKRLNAEQQRLVASPMRELDTILALLAAAAPVDVMPGESDPANYTLPQQPLHPCLLRNASRFASLKRVTNPHEAKIGERVFLGSSGQPLRDMERYTTLEAEGADPTKPPCLRRLEETLEWRHMAPTAPETLGCYPFVTEDPFIIEECPDVYFAGNQPQFATSLLEGPAGQKARLVCVPPFASTGEAALLDLETLDCTPLRFSNALGGGNAASAGAAADTKAVAAQAAEDAITSPAIESEPAAAD